MFTECVRSPSSPLSATKACAVVSLPRLELKPGELSRTATPLCRLVTQDAGRRTPIDLCIPLFATYKHIVGRYSRVDVGTAIGLLGCASKEANSRCGCRLNRPLDSEQNRRCSTKMDSITLLILPARSRSERPCTA